MLNEQVYPSFAVGAELILQSGLLVALVYALSLLVRRGPAEVRYILWLIVAVRLCIPIGFRSPVGMLPDIGPAGGSGGAGSRAWAEVIDGRPVGEPARLASPVPRVAPAGVGRVEPGPELPPLVAAWLVGAGVLALCLAGRWWRARRSVAACEPNRCPELARRFEELKGELGLRARVDLRIVPTTSSLRAPAVFGLWRPVVLLPKAVAESWRLDEIEPMLIHELVHLRRLDLPVNALQCVLQTVYFFHPLVWLVNWKIREERELICDDEVVRRCGGRSGYVRSILRMAECTRESSRLGPAMGMVSRRSSLSRRVVRLLDRDYRHGEQRHALAAGAVLLGLLCVGVVSGRQEEPAAAVRPTWNDEVEALFALRPQASLRLVDPAEFHSRLEAYRALHPEQAKAVPEGPDRMSFVWDPHTRRPERPRFHFGAPTLGQLLHVLGIESHEVVGARSWLSEPVVGDLVVRDGADLGSLLADLGRELARRHGLPLRLEARTELREVVVASGRYDPAGQGVRVGEPSRAPGASPAAARGVRVQRLAASLEMLGRLRSQRVIDEVVARDRSQVDWLFFPGSLGDPDRLLADLARQTSLRFAEETRRLPIVVIAEAEPGASL